MRLVGAGGVRRPCRAGCAAGAEPRGLICLNDRVAMGPTRPWPSDGLTVPGDVSVVSFDGSELATWLRPLVMSVALPFAELGAQAVRLLTGAEPIEPIVTRVAMTVQAGGVAAGPDPVRHPSTHLSRVGYCEARHFTTDRPARTCR